MKTKAEAIQELTELFEINDTSKSRVSGNYFLIHKEEFEREDVVFQLMEYLENVDSIEDSCIKVSPITMLYTKFEIATIKVNET